MKPRHRRRVRVCAAIACLCSTSLASGTPLAQIDADIDGDGTLDRVSVEASGEIAFEGKSRATFVLLPSLVRATLTAANVHNVPTLLVVAASDHDEQSIVFTHGDGGWHEWLRERTGAVDADGDYGIALGLDAAGVYRYQIRPGLRRCDGKPGYLFAEGWNHRRFRRLSKIPIGVSPTAPAIAGRLDTTDFPAPLIYQARFASHQPGAMNAGTLAVPVELADRDLRTYWREEITGSNGEGQFFTFEPRMAGARANQVRIVPGNPSARSPQEFNRPRRIAVVGANAAWHIDLPDAAHAQRGAAYIADLPTAIEGCVTIILESSYGPATGTTAIAELAVLAEGERSGGEAMLAHAVAQSESDAHTASQALAQRGAAGATAIAQELRQAKDEAAKHRLARALLEIQSRSSGPLIAQSIANGWVHDRDLPDAIATLAGRGFTEQLLGLAGIGSPAQRTAVIARASQVPADAILKAIRSSARPAAAADLWRAAMGRASATAQERSAVVAAMSNGLAAASDYELQYRLVFGIAALGDHDALNSLRGFLQTLPQPALRSALEQVAANAVAAHPRADAAKWMLSLLRDPDPGVRSAVLGALRVMQDRGENVDREIESALASDTWPEVRQRAAQALATRCAQRHGASALQTAFSRDPDLGVRSVALAALVECRTETAGQLLVEVWDTSSLPLSLRTQAVDLAVILADRATTDQLIHRFDRWQRQATESPAALALAQTAAFALGRLSTPEADAALERTLDDASVPQITAAAAAGLGALGPSCPIAALRRLRSLESSSDPQVRGAARRAAAQCRRSASPTFQPGN